MVAVPPSLALVVLLYSHTGGAVGSGVGVAGVHARLVEALRSGGAQVATPAVDAALAERRAGWRSAEELSFFARGRSALERGRRARERVELEEAAGLLAEAETSYAEGLALPGGPSLAAEAALERGVSLAELGRLEDARAAFRRALALAPGVALTERVARPDVVKLFREVGRAPQRPGIPRRFTIAGRPSADTLALFIDGQPSRSEAMVSSGWHLVVLEREGTRAARLLELLDADAVIDLPLPSDPVVERLRALREGPSEVGLRTLLDTLDVGAALVGVLAADQRHLLVSRVARGCATAVTELDLSTDVAVQRGLRALAERPCRRDEPFALRVDDPRLAPLVVTATPTPKPRRRIWPWAFLGAAGVAAAVVGVTVGLVVTDPRYALRVDGRGFGAP